MKTFVVRVYRSEREAPAEDQSLRGVVDEVETGSRTAFTDSAALLAILAQAAPPSRVPGEGAGPGSTCAENRSARHPLARRNP